MTRRPRHNTPGERMIDLFAEELSIDGSSPEASRRLGIRPDYGRQLLKRIRKDLGWQAQ